MIQRDRNGDIYKVVMTVMPPPSYLQHENAQHYAVNELTEAVNELLNRVYELEKRQPEPREPKPSGMEY